MSSEHGPRLNTGARLHVLRKCSDADVRQARVSPPLPAGFRAYVPAFEGLEDQDEQNDNDDDGQQSTPAPGGGVAFFLPADALCLPKSVLQSRHLGSPSLLLTMQAGSSQTCYAPESAYYRTIRDGNGTWSAEKPRQCGASVE